MIKGLPTPPPLDQRTMIEGYACGGRVKKAAGGAIKGCHNPDNKLPRKAMHIRGRNRGM
jgi:hypothetical protein